MFLNENYVCGIVHGSRGIFNDICKRNTSDVILQYIGKSDMNKHNRSQQNMDLADIYEEVL